MKLDKDLFRRSDEATMEMIEDSLDVAILEAAMDRVAKNGSKMYTFEEAGKELGFL